MKLVLLTLDCIYEAIIWGPLDASNTIRELKLLYNSQLFYLENLLECHRTKILQKVQ